MPLVKKHVVLVKEETTLGVDSSPGASDAVQVLNPAMSGPTFEQQEEEYASTDLDASAFSIGLGSGELTFQTIARGSGNKANAPETDSLFKTSGMKQGDFGDLDVSMSDGRFVLGQEIEETIVGGKAIVMYPQASAGLMRVYKMTTGDGFTDTNALQVNSGPDWLDTPVVATNEYAASGYGYQPESTQYTTHGIGSFATTAPVAGELVVYTDTGSGEVVGAGKVISITDGSTMSVELYYAKGGVGINVGDTVARIANAAHSTTISGSVAAGTNPSATVVSIMDGYYRKMLGSRGSWSFEATAGETGKFTFSYTGTPNLPIDQAAPGGISYPSTSGPRFVAALAELNGHRFSVQRIACDIGNQRVDRLNANATSGSDGQEITSREATFTMDLAYPGVGTFDFPSKYSNGDTIVGGAVIGTSSGNQVAVVMPNGQITAIEDLDTDGFMGWSITCRCLRRSDNDSLLIDYR